MRKALANASADKGGGSKMHNTLVYLRQHWQLYVLFMLPAFALTVIFRYIPMGGILIAFTEYNPFRGILGSEWIGFENFERFLSSPDVMRYLVNTLKLSIFGLLWGFPAPILLAFLLNRILSKSAKQKIQLVHGGGALVGVHDDHALCIPHNLHRIRNLAGRRLGFHHLYSRSLQCQQRTEGSSSH